LGIVAQGVVRFLACAGLLAAGLLMGGGVASADTGFGGLGGFGIGDEKKNDNQPRNDADQRPVSPPIVRIGARDDRGGFEVGPGGIRISREPGFRGGFDMSPDGPRHTLDERGISGAFHLGPSGSRVTFGRAPSGGSGASGKQGEQAETDLSPSGTRVESAAEVAASGQGSSAGRDASEGSAQDPFVGRAAVAQRLTIYIPLPRLLTGTGARARSSFTAVVISVPTGSILRAFGQSQPRPKPTPSPSFRTAEVPAEVPNVEVIDSSGEGGSDYAQAGDSQPVRAPLVIAPPPVAPPRPVAPPAAPPVIPPVAVAPPPAGGRPGSQVHVPNSIVAGAPPLMRGPAPTPAPPPATAAVPVEVPATRLGYQRYLRTAKVTDMAVVALPGVVGLVLMTVSGTVIGHRQARAGHMLRHTGTARFMP
jgi:hypothetical protein